MAWRLVLSSSAAICNSGPLYHEKPSTPSHVTGSKPDGVSCVRSYCGGSRHTFHGIGSSHGPSLAMTVPVTCSGSPCGLDASTVIGCFSFTLIGLSSAIVTASPNIDVLVELKSPLT